MWWRLSLSQLAGVAGAVGIVGAGSSLVLIHRTRLQITREDYYTKAFTALEANKAATDLIGRPVMRSKIKWSDDKNNSVQSLTTRLKVPIKGVHRSGHLFIFADRQHVDNEWTLRRLEIIFDDIIDKKVIVYKDETNY